MKHPIDELVQRLYGMSDDQLLQAFKEAEAETEANVHSPAVCRITAGTRSVCAISASADI